MNNKNHKQLQIEIEKIRSIKSEITPLIYFILSKDPNFWDNNPADFYAAYKDLSEYHKQIKLNV